MTTMTYMATEKQVKLLTDLISERQPEQLNLLVTKLATGLTKQEASAKISYLLSLPKPAKAAGTTKHLVPAGRYALNTGEKLCFYKVGVYNGFNWVRLMASDTLYPVSPVAKNLILGALQDEAARKEAMLRYGTELGHCGHCGRTLTDENSRAAGIGPVCAGKLGW